MNTDLSPTVGTPVPVNCRKRRRSFIALLCSLAFCLSSGSPAASAAENAFDVTNVVVGLNNVVRVGAWSSIEFDVQGPEGTVITPVIRASDPDGQATLQPLPSVKFVAGRPAHVRGLFRTGKINAFIQIQLLEDHQVRHRITLRTDRSGTCRVLKQSTSTWVAVGDQPLFTRGLTRWNVLVPGSAELIELPDLSNSIWSPDVLDGIDAMVLNGAIQMDERSSHSIRDWVRRGGKLIVAVGDGVKPLSLSPLSQWLPMAPQGQTDVAKLVGIQDLVARSSPLRTLTSVPAAQLDRTQGIVIANGLAGPLVLRAAYGTGQVTMVAVRLDESPLSNWEAESQSQLAGVLADIPLPWETGTGKARPRTDADFDPSAVTDLQSQLNQTLDQFEGVSRAAPWSVMGWIALFVLIIGPLDYYLVRHWLNRPEWTWGTLLGWTILASGLAIARGNTLNEHPAEARQIDFIDVDLMTKTIRGQSWYSFYSEHDQRHLVEVVPNSELLPQPPETLKTSWVNRPGEGFRGMYGSGGIDNTKPQYRFTEDQSGIENFPVRKWSTAAVRSEWETVSSNTFSVEANLEENGINRVQGTITHHFPGELNDWFLAYGNFLYFDRSGTAENTTPLAPGTQLEVTQLRSNLLRGRLIAMMQQLATGVPSNAIDDQFQRTEYDITSTDPLTWGLAVTFYQTLGGLSYTGLQNESLKHLDLSESLGLHRAVLFGRLEHSPVEFKLNEGTLPLQDRSTMVRVMIPVRRMIRSSDSPPTKDLLQAPQ